MSHLSTEELLNILAARGVDGVGLTSRSPPASLPTPVSMLSRTQQPFGDRLGGLIRPAASDVLGGLGLSTAGTSALASQLFGGAAMRAQEEQALVQQLSGSLAHHGALQNLQQVQALSSASMSAEQRSLQSLLTPPADDGLAKQLLLNQLLNTPSSGALRENLLPSLQQQQVATASDLAQTGLLRTGASTDGENLLESLRQKEQVAREQVAREQVAREQVAREQILINRMLGNFGENKFEAASADSQPQAPLFNIGVKVPEPERSTVISKAQQKKKTKRPLSAYNIFFKEEHAKIIAENNIASESEERVDEDRDRSEEVAEGRDDCEVGDKRKRESSSADEASNKRGKRQLDFENLTKIIGKRWKELPPERVQHYKDRAGEAMQKHRNKLFRKIRHSVNASRQ